MQIQDRYDCAKCKAVRMLCGRNFCPLLRQQIAMEKLEKQLVNLELVGSSSSVFVGSQNYPKLNVGALSSGEYVDYEPERMFGKSLQEIVDTSVQLFRNKDGMRVNEAMQPSKHLAQVQEVAMSEGNVFSDTEFKKKPKMEVSFSGVHQPFGPSGTISKYNLESNPRVSQKVEKVVDDDLMSYDQMTLMHDKNVSVHTIQKVMSVGLLGVNKKLVPTRWSITATDDTIAKNLLEQIRQENEIGEYLLFSSEYIGNKFQIMLIPGKWSFDVIECMGPDSLWAGSSDKFVTDYEGFKARTAYADNVAGGYYAARLPVTEYLAKKNKQATAIVVRRIYGSYHTPVGVWQVRENVRNGMRSKPEKFNTLDEMLKKVDKEIGLNWKPHSEVLKTVRSREVMKKYFV